MNMEENPLLWHYLEFLEIYAAEQFSKINPKGFKDHVK
jgi:hypothetical protein